MAILTSVVPALYRSNAVVHLVKIHTIHAYALPSSPSPKKATADQAPIDPTFPSSLSHSLPPKVRMVGKYFARYESYPQRQKGPDAYLPRLSGHLEPGLLLCFLFQLTLFPRAEDGPWGVRGANCEGIFWLPADPAKTRTKSLFSFLGFAASPYSCPPHFNRNSQDSHLPVGARHPNDHDSLMSTITRNHDIQLQHRFR